MKSYIEVLSLSNIKNGELRGSSVAVNMPSRECKMVMFKAHATNKGNIYIGGDDTITAANNTTNETAGYRLDAGENTPWFTVANMDKLWRICDTADDNMTYVLLG